ncbi:QRFP-like peptide receptor [Antedon mediterranea]|uniref:QRFP-like peptide receptor n=1 Tax=Antedon mediterranea TaxID=105859 RepID=UPI003AF72DBC
MASTTPLYGIVGCFGCLTNTFALYILFYLPNRFKTTNLLIINQSIIDLLSSLLTLCQFLDPNITTRLPESEFAADFVCKFWSCKYLLWSSVHTSTSNLVVLTVYRYFAVVYPLKYNVMKEKVSMKLIVLLIPWLSGFGFTLIWLASHMVKDGECILSWQNYTFEVTMGIMDLFYILIIPITIMIFVYVKIFHALRSEVGDGLSSIRSTISPRRLNIIKTLVMVSVTYIICWTPNQLAYVLISIDNTIIVYKGTLHQITIIMAMTNSGINPIIYTFKYIDFITGVPKTLPFLFKMFS